MAGNKRYSHIVTVFQGRKAPELGYLIGYGLIHFVFDLTVPLPGMLALISNQHKRYTTDEWLVFTPRYMPPETLMGHLTFALKYEGIDLGILKKLFEKLEARQVADLINSAPTGQYSRKIWFLYEWLMDVRLDIPDLTSANYVDLVDEAIQYGCHATTNSQRHRLRNNLPGLKDFCPMIRKTALLERYVSLDLTQGMQKLVKQIHPDVMAKAAAFLMLKDSKASFAIEGERPPQNRTQRWGRAIGQAGMTPITKDELVRLQQIVIENPRFTKMGFRDQEGFIGEHDRRYGTPIPNHISARWKDLEILINGLLAAGEKMEMDSSFDPIFAAALIAFGFVFIHPFIDGNGRIHRYLIHHVLLRKAKVSHGIIFPVSAIILERLEEYRKVLEYFSKPRLDLIDWRPAENNNVEVLNETIDLYRYFDATKQVEFLYSCVEQTITVTIPEEIAYLEKYDLMKYFLDNKFEMPDSTVALLIRFLDQGKGKLSERAKTKEFTGLTSDEVDAIETKYQEIFP